MKKFLFAAVILLCFNQTANAYPEFYEYSRKTSGRSTNCALCHTHGDGPEGNEPGQINALNKEELERLMRARTAFLPGQMVQSPILNDFGNELIKELGKKKILELKNRPQELAKEIGKEMDLDKDGIPDSEEYLDGTLSISKEDGHPAKLFFANLKKHIMHIILAFFAVVCLFYGFVQWLMGIDGEAIIDDLKKGRN